ncbi:MAG: hypothetical protein E7557_09905 [Ruminococcaceae bacterium]|nr:hypothetical protein [Oscillospiraceae bacterium]
MRCENKFCFYQSQNECIYNDVELDCNGTYKRCIKIKLNDEELKNLKEDSKNDLIYLAKEFSKKKNESIFTLK